MCRSTDRKGFTLVELAVVIVIIGVLAAFGVPRFIKSVERSKASESFGYLSAVRAAQERYHAREGLYADDLSLLDINQSTPKYFTVGDVTATETTWTLTLTRKDHNAGYGNYTVIFTQDGYSTESGINELTDINPMGSEITSASSEAEPAS
jgi:prepilin-type N-terminal cleavage/methylation domain-containing protein